MTNTATTTERATFAAGCFWGVEEAFRTLPCVIETSVGYTGGHMEHPTYEQVCSDRTGHAEAVQVTYDSRLYPEASGGHVQHTTYEKLLEVFWEIHDPTQHHRQGPDVGSQYRSAVFYHSNEQKRLAEKSKAELQKSGRFGVHPIVTEIVPAGMFWPAEDYHQKYLMKRGAKVCL